MAFRENVAGSWCLCMVWQLKIRFPHLTNDGEEFDERFTSSVQRCHATSANHEVYLLFVSMQRLQRSTQMKASLLRPSITARLVSSTAAQVAHILSGAACASPTTHAELCKSNAVIFPDITSIRSTNQPFLNSQVRDISPSQSRNLTG